MVKSKQHSAVQRREQVRQQRRDTDQQRTPARNRNVRKHNAKGNPWLLIAVIVGLVAIVVVIFVYIANQQQTATTAGSGAVEKAITNVSPNLLSTVGSGSATNSMHAVHADPLKGPNGHPEFFYAGGEYCPFCATQRWAVIIALSRFGKFGTLTPLISGEDNISTFTFHNVTYTSQYVDLVAVETADNQFPGTQPLDKLTAQQQQLFEKYDAPPYVTGQAGAIPFIDIANQQVSAGAYYPPDALIGHSYPDIANQMKDTNSDISRGMLGAANDLTAAICAATNNQPANVCTSDPIPQIQQSLPKASLSPTHPQGVVSSAPHNMIVRRQDSATWGNS